MGDGITFLGTAGDPYVAGKQLRASGGIVIKVNDYQLHIDPGPGALVKAKQYDINPRENTAVLISHSHLGHCNDVNAILGAMSHNKLDIKGVLVTTKNFMEKNYLTEFHKECVEKIIPLEAGKKLGIEELEIHALKAFHEEETIGFKIFTPKFVIVYSSDTKYNKELIKQYQGTDILILNTVNPFNLKKPSQLSSDDALKIIRKTKPELCIINHFGKKMLEANPIYEARELQKQTGVQVIASEDGMLIDSTSYDAEMKQKTLLNLTKTKKAKQKSNQQNSQ